MNCLFGGPVTMDDDEKEIICVVCISMLCNAKMGETLQTGRYLNSTSCSSFVIPRR
jgi:hypothetical protein